MRPHHSIRRVWLFARDYINEFSVVWSLARTRDCERNGGHRWSAPHHDEVFNGPTRTCKRCGCSESVQLTCGTGMTSTTATKITVWGTG